ncbi:hypothetical protein FZC83_02080 [Rossellomorea marisflavi]|uniref:Uncharacterized protein n=1 Tax=Rossellomorea marisflavi TaxID=189381 RepID=A0A5D4S2Q1_9BACI|nr:hypothetical protein [Rossellomorea marisflavi]TYS56384.1 hypothetical protein FZC83_02080 [Rossellomorea marisflavi]
MRDPNRIKRIMTLIEKLWERHPDTRFNQLISNLSWEYSAANGGAHTRHGYLKEENEHGIWFRKDLGNVDLFYVEDDKFEEFLKNKLKVK